MKNTYYIVLDTGKMQKEVPAAGYFTTYGYRKAREVAHLCQIEHYDEACNVANQGLNERED